MEKEEGKTKIKPLPNKSISMYAATCDSDMYQPGWNSRAYILGWVEKSKMLKNILGHVDPVVIHKNGHFLFW